MRCALELHRVLDDEAVTTGLPLWIRVGMHHGHALQRGADLVGNDVNVAARIVDTVPSIIVATTTARAGGAPGRSCRFWLNTCRSVVEHHGVA